MLVLEQYSIGMESYEVNLKLIGKRICKGSASLRVFCVFYIFFFFFFWGGGGGNMLFVSTKKHYLISVEVR